MGNDPIWDNCSGQHVFGNVSKGSRYARNSIMENALSVQTFRSVIFEHQNIENWILGVLVCRGVRDRSRWG
jgi:hypothetical protein